MAHAARISTGKVFPPEDIQRPASIFQIIGQRFKSLATLHRIMSQVRQQDGKTMVVEELALDDADDLVEENEDIRKRLPSFSSSMALRLSFFTKSFKTKRGLSSVTRDEVIGYAILKFDDVPTPPFNGARVYESVIRPSYRHNSFIRGAQDWEFSVAGFPMKVSGYLYAQQNNLTNCCAHVALRTAAASFHPAGDMSYREMNRLTGISKEELPELAVDVPKFDHVNRKIGEGIGTGVGGGLCALEMIRILEGAGARCFKMEYVEHTNAPRPPFEKYIYGSLESGYAAIVGFKTGPDQQHAIPLFGHTFNEDAWVPSAQLSYFKIGQDKYIPSDSWLSTFIGHDDNWGSNFCVPRHYLRTRRSCNKVKKGPVPCPMESRYVTYVIGTFPGSVAVDSTEAEAIGIDYLSPLLDQLPPRSDAWARRLEGYFRGRLLVVRPILIDVDDYLGHLTNISDWRGARIGKTYIRILKQILGPRKLWMIELSVPQLFSANRRKIAEVLISADVDFDPNRRFNNFLLARLPGWFAIPRKIQAAGPSFRFFPTAAREHVQLYGCE